MKNSFSYLGVQVGGNRMGRREHSFTSIILKPQIFIPLKLRGIGGNGIDLMIFFIKIPKNSLYI